MSVETYNEIYYTICPVGNATYLAVHKGFLKEGLNKIGVTPTQLQTLPYEYWPAHYTFENPKLFRDGGNTPTLWAISRGADPVILGLNNLGERMVLMVRKDSGIKTIQDLRGKRFAMPLHPNAPVDYHKASAEAAYEQVLAAASLTKEDVQFVELYSPDDYVSSREQRADILGEIRAELAALDNNEVDVIFMKLSTIQVLMDMGNYEILYDLTEHKDQYLPINNEYPDTLTVTRPLMESRPEIVVEFVKQNLIAAEWAKANQDEAETLLARQTFGNLTQYRGSYHSDFYTKLAPNLSEASIAALENRCRFLYDHGYLEKAVDVHKWIDDYFLKEAIKQLQKESIL